MIGYDKDAEQRNFNDNFLSSQLDTPSNKTIENSTTNYQNFHMLFPAKTPLDLNENFDLTINNFLKKSHNINDFKNNINLSFNNNICKSNNNNLKYNFAESMKTMHQTELQKNKCFDISLAENIFMNKNDKLSKFSHKSEINNINKSPCSNQIKGQNFNLLENFSWIQSSNAPSVKDKDHQTQNGFKDLLVNYDKKTLKDIMDIKNLFRFPFLPTFEEYLKSLTKNFSENSEAKNSTNKEIDKASSDPFNYSS